MASSSRSDPPTISVPENLVASFDEDIAGQKAIVEELVRKLQAEKDKLFELKERKRRRDHGVMSANRILDAIFFLPKFSNVKRDAAAYKAHIAAIKNQLNDIVVNESSRQLLFDGLDAIFTGKDYLKEGDSEFAFSFPVGNKSDGSPMTSIQHGSQPFYTLQYMKALLVFLNQRYDPNQTQVNPSSLDAASAETEKAPFYDSLMKQFDVVFPEFQHNAIALINF